MADVFTTEDYEDLSEENNENFIDLSNFFKESPDMNLKQDNNECEIYSVEEFIVNPDDLLPPLVKLEKYANSDIVFNRQVVARNLLETLRLVHENRDDVTRIINVFSSISEDYDPSVRTELMVQLPHIAAFCTEVKLNVVIAQYLVPILLSYLRDENNLVRKSSHAALLSILEQGCVGDAIQTEKIWPLVLHMTENMNSEEIRTESISLMSKLVVLMGAEEQFFDSLFALCADRCNNVRKACASTFGEICTAVGRDITEELLLPKFFILCEDTAWCVRKACAENFMQVSCIVSREIRCRELSSLYMILLNDQSRWVRVTAFQALGPFISTFAEPDKTGLYYSKEGVLTIVDSPSLKVESKEQTICNDASNCNGDLNISAFDGKCSDSDIDGVTSEFCDNVVPLNSVATSQSSNVPNVSCQVGNYCTVIEVNSFSSTNNAMYKTSSDKNTEQCCNELQTIISSSDSSNSLVSDSGDEVDALKCDRLHQSEEEFNKLWQEVSKVCEESSNMDVQEKHLNGDSDIIINKLYVSDKNWLSIKKSEERTLGDSITVNGEKVHLYNPIPLPQPSFDVINGSSSTPEEQYIFNNLSKYLGALSNTHSPSSGDSKNVESDYSNGKCVKLLGFKISGCKNLDKESDNDMLNSTSDIDSESAFNSFQYWRDPLPPIEIEKELNCVNQSVNFIKTEYIENIFGSSSNKKKQQIMKPKRLSQHPCQEEKYTFPVFVKPEKLKDKSQTDLYPENKGEPPPSKLFTVNDQDIVPPELLSQYLNMIDSAWAQTIDAEIARHCAYSLPAVALTLGRNYWPCLKDTFDALTSDLQGFIMMWKVRRTVASALHQLAVILGPEITSKDLLPVFSRFINDLDEVRIGILQHLYDFLKILRPSERVQFLPSLSKFLVSNSDADINEKNWRFRLILAEQLVCIAELYEPQHVRDHLVPLSLTLIRDKVCEVRLAAVRVVAAVMKRMNQSPTQTLTKTVFNELTEKFVHSPKWLHRQLYVYVCQECIVENALTAGQFAEDALPQLLFLCWDRVPNVRLAIARCLVTALWPLETFSNPDSHLRDLLLETIHTLQSDVDADVRYYANMVSTSDCSCLQNGEFNSVGDSFV